MFHLYKMESHGDQLTPVYTGLSHAERLGLRDHILATWNVDIDQHWIIEDSFACGHFVLTTTPPAQMRK